MLRQRNSCPRCLKSLETCYCRQVRPFRAGIEFVLLQHPKERRKTIGTARMAHLCIENSRLICGLDFGRDAEVNRLIADPANHCVVLYPGEGSRNIGTESASEVQGWFPAGRRLVIFVIDGSWACAGKMLRRSPNLLALPRICFTPVKGSEYRIRRQPEAHCLSTIEAVHRILEILEPAVDASNLLEIFRSMVEYQLKFSGLNFRRRSMEVRVPPAPRAPV